MKANRKKRLKAEHIFSLICETLIAGQDGRFSFINVIANVRLPKIPYALGSLGIVVSFQASPGDVFDLAVEDPKRKSLFRTGDAIVEDQEMYQKFPNMVRATQVGIIAAPMKFTHEGIHHIVLRVSGRVVHREPFGVFVDPDFVPGEPKDVSNNELATLHGDSPDKQRVKR